MIIEALAIKLEVFWNVVPWYQYFNLLSMCSLLTSKSGEERLKKRSSKFQTQPSDISFNGNVFDVLQIYTLIYS